MLSLLLSACATNPPDVPICTEIDMSRGWCTFTISEKEFYITDTEPYSFNKGEKPQTWWDMRPTFVLIPASSWAKIKEYVINVCHQTNNCDKAVGSWERRADAMDAQLNSKSQ